MARILVVDDEIDVARTIDNILSSRNHVTIIESDSEKAHERLSSESFDLIISDLFMPQFNGLDILVTAQKVSPDTPILIMTGGSRYFPSGTAALQEVTNSAELFGASAILRKPFKSLELLSAVDELLAARGGNP